MNWFRLVRGAMSSGGELQFTLAPCLAVFSSAAEPQQTIPDKHEKARSQMRRFGMDGGEWKNRPGGTRTPDQGIMRTNHGFRRPFRVCGLDCLFSLRVRRTVSTPSSREAWLGISLSLPT